MITKLRSFGGFWYDFIVGDDWRVAVAVVLSLAVTFLVSISPVPAWWVVPLAIVIFLPLSLWRATRKR